MSVEKQLVSLPSKCKVYEGVDPKNIKIGLLLGKHEKVISEISPDNYEKKLGQILSDVVEGIAVETLTLGDMKYLMLWLAVNSYSKEFPIKFTCEHCFAKLEIIVDLSKIQVVELPDEFQEPYPIELIGGNKIFLRLMRVEDERKSSEVDKAGANAWIYRFARTVVDNNMQITDKIQMLENLPAVDMARIRAFHEKYDHGPVMEAIYECEKCGGDGLVPVPFRLEMLFPVGKTLKKYYGATV